MNEDINYLSLEQILEIHHRVMDRYGEGEQAGVMFKDRLLSAIVRPQASYFGQELYPTLWDKVGALAQSLCQEHVFYNGNKRTAFAVIQLFLFINGFRLKASPKESEMMILDFVTDNRFKGDDGAREIGKIIREMAEKISE